MWTPPKIFFASCAARSISCTFETSATNEWISPTDESSLRVDASSSAFRAAINTAAPFSRNILAIVLPIPLLPPKMTAFLFLSNAIASFIYFFDDLQDRERIFAGGQLLSDGGIAMNGG